METRECYRAECSEQFSVAKKSNPKKFCSQSCAATVNNKKSPKRKLTKKCKACGGSCRQPHNFCDECSAKTSRAELSVAYRQQKKIESWLSGEWSGEAANKALSRVIKKYLIKEAGFACSLCGFDKRHPDDGLPILEIDHIDGNGENHSPDNLRVLCPNCHALTSTYRGRNYGKGRKVFYKRIARSI